MIFKGKVFLKLQFEGFPEDQRFKVSPNGQISNKIGFYQLQKLFILSTSLRTKRGYRLLILNGHGSYLIPKFNEICEQNKVILICILVYLSYLLQPLNIDCFTVLKRSYGRMVKTKIQVGINYIDKLNFLEVYPSVRIEAFKSETIKNSFLATGLILFRPD